MTAIQNKQINTFIAKALTWEQVIIAYHQNHNFSGRSKFYFICLSCLCYSAIMMQFQLTYICGTKVCWCRFECLFFSPCPVLHYSLTLNTIMIISWFAVIMQQYKSPLGGSISTHGIRWSLVSSNTNMITNQRAGERDENRAAPSVRHHLQMNYLLIIQDSLKFIFNALRKKKKSSVLN